MAGDLHGYLLWNASPDHVPDCGAPEIMEDFSFEPDLLAGRCSVFPEVDDLLPLRAGEDQGAVRKFLDVQKVLAVDQIEDLFSHKDDPALLRLRHFGAKANHPILLTSSTLSMGSLPFSSKRVSPISPFSSFSWSGS